MVNWYIFSCFNMKNAIIFHGTGGHPQENWFPWLKVELEKLGYTVMIPQFPTPNNQTPETWFKVFSNYEKELNPETILIGHSLGGGFLLRVLEHIKTKVKAAFFVAAPIGVLPIKYYEGDKPFIGKPFDWAKIRQKAEKFFVFHADKDELVSPGNGEELAKNLGVDLILVPGAGHFNAKAGYTKFELILKRITEELQMRE